MTYKVFVESFKSQVNTMSHEKGLELAIIICKELFPDYQKFSETHNWGDPELLLEGIKLCEVSRTRVLNKSDIDTLVNSLEKAIPDTEDFGDYDGSYALNAGAAVLSSLLYIIDKSPKYLLDIGTLYIDTIDFRLHETNVVQNEIDNHPLMQEARQRLIVLAT